MDSGDCVGATGVDSEEYFTQDCDICKQDGIRKQAEIYCSECEESLCDGCQNWHKKSRGTRNHAVKIFLERRVTSAQKYSEPYHVARTLCSCNQKIEVSYFCTDHQELICTVCSKIKHAKCKTATIEQISSRDSVAVTFMNISKRIDLLVDKSSELCSKVKDATKALHDSETRYKEEIKAFKNEIINLLDKLETNILEDLHSKIESQRGILAENNDSLVSAVQLLNVDKELIETTKKMQDRRELFIANVKVEKSLEHYENVLTEVKKNIVLPNIEFEKNTKLLQGMSCLGTIISLNVDTKCKSGHKKVNFLDMQYKETTSFDISDIYDHYYSNSIASGVTFLNNDNILIADCQNCRLTLLDPSLKVQESLKCTSNPWDIAVVSDQEVIVTLPSAQTLQYFKVSPKLQADRTIKLGGGTWCYGVAVANNCIYISRCERGKPTIQVLDMSGTVLKTIDETTLNIKLTYPYYVALAPSGNKIYISNCDSGQIICMTTEGKHIFTYSDQELQWPSGMVVDEDDNVLVCGGVSNNIHVIKSDGTKYKVLVTLKEGIERPRGIAYSSASKKLLVGGWDVKHLKQITFM